MTEMQCYVSCFVKSFDDELIYSFEAMNAKLCRERYRRKRIQREGRWHEGIGKGSDRKKGKREMKMRTKERKRRRMKGRRENDN
jgi:hypothetical protein